MVLCELSSRRICGPRRCPVIKNVKICEKEEATIDREESSLICEVTPVKKCFRVRRSIPEFESANNCQDTKEKSKCSRKLITRCRPVLDNSKTAFPDLSIMVIGGNRPVTSTAEFVARNNECSAPPTNFPSEIYGAAGGSLNGTPTVCGGFEGTHVSSECHGYDYEHKTWNPLGKMGTGRYYFGWAHDDSWGLVMTGGFNRTQIFDTVERTHDGVHMEILPALPQPRWHHCLAVLDSDTLFVAGGLVNKGKSDTALVYMAGRRQWGGIKARMPGGPRSNHICGVSTLPGGAKEVIVAGGYGGHVRYLDTVEIYSVSEYKWRTSNPMPWGVISDAAVIQYKGCKDGFAVVGGYVPDLSNEHMAAQGTSQDTVYAYSNGTWNAVGATMRTGRRQAVAIVADKAKC